MTRGARFTNFASSGAAIAVMSTNAAAKAPSSSASAVVAPRLAINYTPPTDAQAVNKAFADWLEVSKWASTLHDAQVVIDDAELVFGCFPMSFRMTGGLHLDN